MLYSEVSLTDRCFRRASCLNRQGDRPDDGGSKHLWNVDLLLWDYSIPEDIHTRGSENPKSQSLTIQFVVFSQLDTAVQNVCGLWHTVSTLHTSGYNFAPPAVSKCRARVGRGGAAPQSHFPTASPPPSYLRACVRTCQLPQNKCSYDCGFSLNCILFVCSLFSDAFSVTHTI
jgi:hypothetical protein